MISLWKLVGVETFACLSPSTEKLDSHFPRKEKCPNKSSHFLLTDWLNFQLRSLSLWGAWNEQHHSFCLYMSAPHRPAGADDAIKPTAELPTPHTRLTCLLSCLTPGEPPARSTNMQRTRTTTCSLVKKSESRGDKPTTLHRQQPDTFFTTALLLHRFNQIHIG